MFSSFKSSKKINSSYDIKQNENCSQNEKYGFASKVLNNSNSNINFIKAQMQPTSKENIHDLKLNEFSDSDIPPDLSSQNSEKVINFAKWGTDSQITSQELFGSDYIYLRSSQSLSQKSSQKSSQNIVQNVFLGVSSQLSQTSELFPHSQKSISSSQKSNYFDCSNDKLKMNLTIETPVNSQEEKSILFSNDENIFSKKGKCFGELNSYQTSNQFEPNIFLNDKLCLTKLEDKNNFNSYLEESNNEETCSNEFKEQRNFPKSNSDFYSSHNYNLELNDFTKASFENKLVSHDSKQTEFSSKKIIQTNNVVYDNLIEKSNTSISSDHRPYTPTSLIEDYCDENSNDTVSSLKRKNSAVYGSNKVLKHYKNDMKNNSLLSDSLINLSNVFEKTSLKTPNKLNKNDVFFDSATKSTRTRNNFSNHFSNSDKKPLSTSETTKQKILETKCQMNRLNSIKKDKDSKKLNRSLKTTEPKLRRKPKLNLINSSFTDLEKVKTNSLFKKKETKLDNSNIEQDEKIIERRLKNNESARKFRLNVKIKQEEAKQKRKNLEEEEKCLKKELVGLLVKKNHYLGLISSQQT